MTASRIEQALDKLDATVVRAWGVGGITLVETRMDAILTALRAAAAVSLNAQGTTSRHTTARDGGCRDDCIPCGQARLRAALDALAASVLGEEVPTDEH